MAWQSCWVISVNITVWNMYLSKHIDVTDDKNKPRVAETENWLDVEFNDDVIEKLSIIEAVQVFIGDCDATDSRRRRIGEQSAVWSHIDKHTCNSSQHGGQPKIWRFSGLKIWKLESIFMAIKDNKWRVFASGTVPPTHHNLTESSTYCCTIFSRYLYFVCHIVIWPSFGVMPP